MSVVQVHHDKHPRNEEINEDLRSHIEALDDWEHTELLTKLYEWTDIFINSFNMRIPLPVLGIAKLPKNRLAQFLSDRGEPGTGRNPQGLNYEILFNIKHLDRPYWRILGTLLPELCHLWQDMWGKAPKTRGHNKEFQSYVGSFGLIVDRKGFTMYEEGKFTELLEVHGVEYDLGDEVEPPVQTRVKKIKWYCKCQMFPIVVEEGMAPNATCNDCNTKYKPKEK